MSPKVFFVVHVGLTFVSAVALVFLSLHTASLLGADSGYWASILATLGVVAGLFFEQCMSHGRLDGLAQSLSNSQALNRSLNDRLDAALRENRKLQSEIGLRLVKSTSEKGRAS